MPLVELQNLNDLVTDSHHLGHARSATKPIDNHGGRRPTKKRSLEDPEVEGTKRLQRGEDLVVVEVVAIVVAEVGFLRRLAELILTPLEEL
jgi:hypothetical protein